MTGRSNPTEHCAKMRFSRRYVCRFAFIRRAELRRIPLYIRAALCYNSIMYESLFEKNDAVLIFGGSNRFYFTGIETSFGCVLLLPDSVTFYTDFRYEVAARKAANGYDVVITTPEKLYGLLADKLSAAGAKFVGYEDDKLTVSQFKALKKALGSYTFRSVSGALENMRSVKTESEIEKIKKAQDITEHALTAVLPYLKAGVSERDISAELTYRFLKLGADGLAFENIVAFGENASDCHHTASDRKLERGDVVLFDIGAKADGYCSDMTRTFVYGEPVRRISEVFDLVLSAQQTVLDFLKAGMTGREADSIAREIFRANGFEREFGHSLGHGVGIDIHENPRLSANNTEPLPENCVVTVEPGLYLEKFGVRIEDMVVVKKDGIENLTNFAKSIII